MRDTLAGPSGNAIVKANEHNGVWAKIDGFKLFIDSDYDEKIAAEISRGTYERWECELVRALVNPGDRVIEAGTAIGLVSMTAASIVGAENILTFDANPHIVEAARQNFLRNNLTGINARVGVLKNRSSWRVQGETVDFYIAKAFWASRLNVDESDGDIVEKVKVPVFCLEEEIAAHRADVLVCDIEGGEVDLLTEADLGGIRLIILETHDWSVGEAATKAMMRKLILDGFAIHQDPFAWRVLALRR